LEFLIIGWRNISRNVRRTILNVIALSLGIFIMIAGLGWVGGYKTYIFGALMDLEAGEGQVLNKNYLEEGRRFPLDLNVKNSHSVKESLLKNDNVQYAAERISFLLKLSNGITSVPLIGNAIDPGPEKDISILFENIVEGQYLDESKGILVGKNLAARMGLKVGDTVYISSVDKYNAPNIIDVKVQGFFHMGYPVLDDNMVYVDITSARSLLSMENEATKIVLRFYDGLNIEKAVKELHQSLSGTDLESYLWKRFVEAGVKAVEADSGGLWIILIIMYMLIILGILNSMSMSVHERIGEIGTIRAIGMKKRDVKKMFLSESISIGIISAIVGVVLVIPVALYLQYTGINMAGVLPPDLPLPFGQTFRADFHVWHFAVSIGSGIVTAIIGGFIPARKAANFSIADSMGSKKIQ
jgi:putative ABC transport system permease protein